MRTITRRAATVVAVGTISLGAFAGTTPVLAGDGSDGRGVTSTVVPGPGMGWPGPGMGWGRDSCRRLRPAAEQGVLTPAQRTTLASMAEEEKLAQDLYAAFAARYDAVVFDHIGRQETAHLDVVRALLRRYGVADPTAGQPAGTFTDRARRAAYARLLAEGGRSRSAALAAAQQVERADIADLEAALDGLTAPDVTRAYTDLLAASRHHLRAVTHWSSWS